MNSPLYWITGASTGIGRATALELARRGYRIIASARSEDKLTGLAAEHASIVALPCDVTDSTAVAAAVQQIERAHGAIDGVILNAGGWDKQVGPLALAHFIGTYDLNVFGVVRVLEHVLPLMKQRRRGHVAITASIAGYGGMPDAYAYTSSKAALINLAESLAIDLAADDIKVQVINPGFVRTPLTAPNKFPMPFLQEPERAATYIADGLAGHRFEIAFPPQLIWPMKLARLLPYDAWIAILRRVSRRIAR